MGRGRIPPELGQLEVTLGQGFPGNSPESLLEFPMRLTTSKPHPKVPHRSCKPQGQGRDLSVSTSQVTTMCMPSDVEATITQMGVQSRGGRWSVRWVVKLKACGLGQEQDKSAGLTEGSSSASNSNGTQQLREKSGFLDCPSVSC